MTTEERIRYYIEKSGHSKKDIAAAIGVSGATISSWCAGKTLPHRRHMEALADVLGVDRQILKGELPIPLPETYEEFRTICRELGIGLTDILRNSKETGRK